MEKFGGRGESACLANSVKSILFLPLIHDAVSLLAAVARENIMSFFPIRETVTTRLRNRCCRRSVYIFLSVSFCFHLLGNSG